MEKYTFWLGRLSENDYDIRAVFAGVVEEALTTYKEEYGVEAEDPEWVPGLYFSGI